MVLHFSTYARTCKVCKNGRKIPEIIVLYCYCYLNSVSARFLQAAVTFYLFVVKGKIALDGSLEDRLDQLDKRESELLALLEKKIEQIKKLSEEKNRWKRRCEEVEYVTEYLFTM